MEKRKSEKENEVLSEVVEQVQTTNERKKEKTEREENVKMKNLRQNYEK